MIIREILETPLNILNLTLIIYLIRSNLTSKSKNNLIPRARNNLMLRARSNLILRFLSNMSYQPYKA